MRGGMKIDMSIALSNRNASTTISLGAALLEILDGSAGSSRDQARQMGRLADRIEGATEPVELSETEISLIENVLDRTAAVRPAWLIERLEYLLWPEKLADSDRERLARKG